MTEVVWVLVFAPENHPFTISCLLQVLLLSASKGANGRLGFYIFFFFPQKFLIETSASDGCGQWIWQKRTNKQLNYRSTLSPVFSLPEKKTELHGLVYWVINWYTGIYTLWLISKKPLKINLSICIHLKCFAGLLKCFALNRYLLEGRKLLKLKRV